MSLSLTGMQGLHGLIGRVRWLLRDDFCDTRAAGAVDGTPATPGPGTRTVVDTGNHMSVNGDFLTTDGSVATGDPRCYYNVVFTRQAGLVALCDIETNSRIYFGFDSGVGAEPDLAALSFNGTPLFAWDGGVARQVGTIVLGAKYKLGIVLRTSGLYCFIKGQAFTHWTLLWFSAANNTANLYLGACGRTGTLDSDFIRVPDALWLPNPLAHDSFTRANGPLGSTEDTGPDGQPSTIRVWQLGGATWAVSANEAVNTPTLGSEELTNGNFTAWTGDDPDNWSVLLEDVNNYVTENPANNAQVVSDGSAGVNLRQSCMGEGWFRIQAVVSAHAVGGLKIYNTDGEWIFQSGKPNAVGTWESSQYNSGVGMSLIVQAAAACDITLDSVSVKRLTTKELFSAVQVATADVLASVEIDAMPVSGTEYAQAGLMLNLDDPDNPQNYVLVLMDTAPLSLGFVRIHKWVAGVRTNVANTSVAYVPGATLVAVKDGTSYSVYYNNSLVGTTQTIADAGIINNTLHGMFSTHEDNQLDNFQVFARGTGNEYNRLDAWSFDGNCAACV